MKTGFQNMRCGLIGEHLQHSFSPTIHSHLCDYKYKLYELRPDEIENFVKNGELDAFNVTIPYKKAVMPFLDEISDEAKRIGAVNTVVRKADGKTFGYNTDYYGFSAMLDKLSLDVKGKKAIILGSGGASVTVKTVLTDRECGKIITVGRNEENNYQNISDHFDADIIINATPVGMYPKNGASLIRLADFNNCIAVLDLIYNPSKTALLIEAEALGIEHINGLYMLVAQAIKAFELFTNNIADNNITGQICANIEFMTKNIVLVGMPSSGKSTVGKAIAQRLCRPFIDADIEFESMHGISPKNAIISLGEAEFRKMESETIKKICKESGTVIATGGGAITREENFAPIRQNSIVVYLQRDLNKLSTKDRPISQSKDLSVLYRERHPLYEKFSHLSVASTEDIMRTAELIINEIKTYINTEA